MPSSTPDRPPDPDEEGLGEDLDFEIAFYEGIAKKLPNSVDLLMALGNNYTRRGRHEDGLAIDKQLCRLRDIKELFMTNLTMCAPPENRDPNRAEIAACKPRLLDAIRLVVPNIIIASGRVAAQVLTGQRTLSVLKRRGEILDCDFEGPFGNYSVPVLVTIAPALLLRNPDVDGGVLSATVEDFRLAWKINDNRIHCVYKVSEQKLGMVKVRLLTGGVTNGAA